MRTGSFLGLSGFQSLLVALFLGQDVLLDLIHVDGSLAHGGEEGVHSWKEA